VVVGSHNPSFVGAFCSRVLVLDPGRLALDDSPQASTQWYAASVGAASADVSLVDHTRSGDGLVRVNRVLINDGIIAPIGWGSNLSITLFLSSTSPTTKALQVAVALYTAHQVPALVVHSTDEGILFPINTEVVVRLTIENVPFSTGEYSLHVAVGNSTSALQYDHVTDVTRISFEGPPVASAHAQGVVILPCRWSEVKIPESASR